MWVASDTEDASDWAAAGLAGLDPVKGGLCAFNAI